MASLAVAEAAADAARQQEGVKMNADQLMKQVLLPAAERLFMATLFKLHKQAVADVKAAVLAAASTLLGRQARQAVKRDTKARLAELLKTVDLLPLRLQFSLTGKTEQKQSRTGSLLEWAFGDAVAPFGACIHPTIVLCGLEIHMCLDGTLCVVYIKDTKEGTRHRVSHAMVSSTMQQPRRSSEKRFGWPLKVCGTLPVMAAERLAEYAVDEWHNIRLRPREHAAAMFSPALCAGHARLARLAQEILKHSCKPYGKVSHNCQHFALDALSQLVQRPIESLASSCSVLTEHIACIKSATPADPLAPDKATLAASKCPSAQLALAEMGDDAAATAQKHEAWMTSCDCSCCYLG